jgi:hypothetical protein
MSIEIQPIKQHVGAQSAGRMIHRTSLAGVEAIA